MNRRHVLLAALAALLVIGAPYAARAWAPIDSSRPVWEGAAPYEMNNAGSPDLGLATSEMLVRQGMDDWTRVACTNLRTTYNGQTSRRPSSGDGASTIGWTESSWRYDSNAIGVTGPRWGGRGIVEADMDLNGQNYTWTTAPGRGNTVNAYSIILHEGGHYYGLGHSSDGNATMYFAYSGGVSMLNADDQNGICALYPGSGSDCTTTGCPTGQDCMAGTCVARTGDGGLCSPCTNGGDCNAGVCLGYPDGAGYCGQSCTSSAQCGSDQCVNVEGVGGQCVRISGGTPSCASGTTGCTSDAQCAATERCNTATRACEPRPTTGAALGAPCGANDECRSGLCFAGQCSQSCDWLDTSSCPAGWYCSGEATGSCSAGTGVCVTGSAGAGAIGDACGASTECASLYCASGVCSTPCIPGGASGCGEGLACQVGAVAGCGSCQQSGTLGDPCETHEDCTSRLCAEIDGDGFCSDYCDDGTPREGFSCRAVGETRVYVPDVGGIGTDCLVNEDCLGGLCAVEGDHGYCTRLCGGTSESCPASFECIATDDPSLSVCRRDGGGCGCSAPGRGQGASGGALAGLGLIAALIAWRRRRRAT